MSVKPYRQSQLYQNNLSIRTNQSGQKSTLVGSQTLGLTDKPKAGCKESHGLISCYRWFDYFGTLFVGVETPTYKLVMLQAQPTS